MSSRVADHGLSVRVDLIDVLIILNSLLKVNELGNEGS